MQSDIQLEEKLSSSVSFYVLDGPGALDQLMTFPQLAVCLLDLMRIDGRTQREGSPENQEIMLLTPPEVTQFSPKISKSINKIEKVV